MIPALSNGIGGTAGFVNTVYIINKNDASRVGELWQPATVQRKDLSYRKTKALTTSPTSR